MGLPKISASTLDFFTFQEQILIRKHLGEDFMSQTRMTRQRALILEALRNVTSHPTADEIYGMVREKMPRISLGTVYRNLDLLANSGEILCLDRAGAQKHFDGDTRPHYHVRCKHCGRIGDVFAAPALPSFNDVATGGFTIEHMDVEFTGVCNACRDSAN